MLKIRDVQWSDLEEISKLDLMEDDKMELKGIGYTEDQIPIVLRESCALSSVRICRCFYEDSTGEIIGVYGVTKDDAIWFLASKRLIDVWKEFVRGTKKEFKYLTKDVTYAYNFVHQRHTRGLRWLKWLGISISSTLYQFPHSEDLYHKIEFIKR